MAVNLLVKGAQGPVRWCPCHTQYSFLTWKMQIIKSRRGMVGPCLQQFNGRCIYVLRKDRCAVKPCKHLTRKQQHLLAFRCWALVSVYKLKTLFATPCFETELFYFYLYELPSVWWCVSPTSMPYLVNRQRREGEEGTERRREGERERGPSPPLCLQCACQCWRSHSPSIRRDGWLWHAGCCCEQNVISSITAISHTPSPTCAHTHTHTPFPPRHPFNGNIKI